MSKDCVKLQSKSYFVCCKIVLRGEVLVLMLVGWFSRYLIIFALLDPNSLQQQPQNTAGLQGLSENRKDM